MKLSHILAASILLSWNQALAFLMTPRQSKAGNTVALEASRRDALGVIGASMFVPQAASAFSQQLDDYAWEPQQQATNGRLDLNAAFVVSRKIECSIFRQPFQLHEFTNDFLCAHEFF